MLLNPTQSVSIIGMACEFAGEADSLANYYRVILTAADATSTISSDRWQVDLESLPSSILHGGFLRRNPWLFDYQLFSLSPKEAAHMDPQHRILLENTYHAIQDAGIHPKELKGSRCGVFIGLGTQDYSRIMHSSGDFAGLHSKGSLGSMAAGRISYHFDLIGPTFVVDTACSSSLIALHQAVKALQNHECDMAIVGGATLILTVDYSLDLARAGLMAKDGRCKPFSRDADGFARGEGVGVVILQRNDNAINEKRRIYANILGSAINGDGKTNGITAPSRESQKRVINDALQEACLQADQVTYIETHGTGTDLGDKIEFSALCDVQQGRSQPIYIGSVKGNIAHCEAAAGIAGIIKTSLCIYNNIIPPHTSSQVISAELRHDLLNAIFPNQIIPKDKIIGGVSSFGMSGANAHVVLGYTEINSQDVKFDQPLPFHHFKRTKLSPDYLNNNTQATSSENDRSLDVSVLPTQWECQINIDLSDPYDAYIAQHVINTVKILPGSYYLGTSMQLIESVCYEYKAESITFYLEAKNILILRPVIFDEFGKESLKVIIRRRDMRHYTLTYYRNSDAENAVCELEIVVNKSDTPKRKLPLHRVGERKSPDKFYLDYAQSGVAYGPLFKRLHAYYELGANNLIAEIQPPDDQEQQFRTSHAAFLDNCFQTLALSLSKVNRAYAPTAIRGFKFYQLQRWNTVMTCHTEITTMTDQYLEANVTIFNAKNEVVMEISGILCQAIDLHEQNQGVVREVDFVIHEPLSIGDETNSSVRLVADLEHPQVSSLLTILSQQYRHVPVTNYNDFVYGKNINESHLVIFVNAQVGDDSEAIFTLFSTIYRALQTLNDQSPVQLKFISVVTCKEYHDEDSHKNLTNALMRAIVLNFPTEFPGITFRYIDYDLFSHANVKYLFYGKETYDAESLSDIFSPYWHIRNNQVYHCRTTVKAPVKLDINPSLSQSMKANGYYLVTGGLGGIGKQIIRYMVEVLGCQNIILTYRSPASLTQENVNFIDDLSRNKAANIICQCVDVTDESALEALFLTLPRPLYGIFHLAGTVADQSLAKTTSESINQALNAKYRAARMLHELSTSIAELEYFVLFSSMAALVSSPGQFDYAFANMGLSNLAEFRNKCQLPVTLIDWGPWADTGMMSRIASHRTSSAALRHFIGMDPVICCKALFTCLENHSTYHFAVFEMSKSVAITIPAPAELELKKSLDSCSQQEEVASFVRSLLVRLIAEETDHDASAIDETISLGSLGLDSINTIRIRSELQAELNLSIPLTVLLDELSISAVTQQIIALWMESRKVDDAPLVEMRAPHFNNEVAEKKFYPLSYNQFSIWFEQHAIQANTAYHCSIAWKIEGDRCDIDRLKTTWERLLQQHEILRAVFTSEEEMLGYRIESLPAALRHDTFVIVDLNSDINIDDYLQSFAARVIHFDNDLPTKVLIARQHQFIYLMLSSHHIVMDASAMFYLGEKLLGGLCDPSFAQPETPTAVSYHEFTDSQKNQHTEFCTHASRFLLSEILDENNSLRAFELPKKQSLTPVNQALGDTCHVVFNDFEMREIMALPDNMRAHICLSAWALLLARYTGESNILIGMAFNGRTQKKWTEVVGHFINLLPICVPVDQRQTCLNFISDVKRKLFNLMEFQDFPLVKLMMQDEIKHALNGRKLLQTYFNYFDASGLNFDVLIPSLKIEPLHYPQQEAQFETSLWVTKSIDKYHFDIKYQADLFDDIVIGNMAQHYKRILLALSQAWLNSNTNHCLLDIKLFTADEESKLLPVEIEAFNQDLSVYDLFNDHVTHQPDAIAIELVDQRITYLKLSELVNQLASSLSEYMCGLNEVVAILTPERATVEFIVTVLALWKLKLAYLPLNKHQPVKRSKYALDVVGCNTMINLGGCGFEDSSRLLFNHNDMHVIDVSHASLLHICELRKPSLRKSITETVESMTAYILFTSGSTGYPKGVVVEHDGLIDRLLWMRDHFNFSSSDKFLQSTQVTFDVSLPEFCLPLICGGVTVLCHVDENPHAHASLCQRHSVTIMSTVPSLFSLLQDDLSHCRSLRHLILIGEVVAPALVNHWLESRSSCVLHNLYGPTEVTVYATAFACLKAVTTSFVPIGEPCKNVIALVLDAYGNLVPRGVVGELYLTGSGVAKGYIGRHVVENPFINNPFQSRYARIYKTGDFVRWADDNTIDFIGRKDSRVKLNGLLIELGEIEQCVLQRFPSVKNVCASIENNRVVLCVMPDLIDAQQIINYLQAHLPGYMIPGKLLKFSEFPRNSNGKIDRKAIAANVKQLTLDEEAPLIGISTPSDLAAMTNDERECVELWERLLNITGINLNDNFFQLGGDSLLLTQMTLLVEKRISVKINFSKFLSNPTINSLVNRDVSNSSQWLKELTMADEIAPFGSSVITNTVLLTGATGHLGIHLLRALLSYTNKHIILIIRADTQKQACDRVKARYQAVFGSVLSLDRVTVLKGDLTHPKLQLDSADFSTICSNVSVIIHAAAEVNHVVDYQRLKSNNVTAVKNMIDIANLANCSHLFYISTQFTETAYLPEAYLNEPLAGTFVSGYEQSKFIAEALMHAATNKGYPITTLRLPLIIDDSDPTLLKQNHFVAYIMKCLRMGSYSDFPQTFDVMPTQQIAKFIAERSVAIPTQSQVLNCFQASVKTADIFSYFNLSTEFSVAIIDHQKWRERVIESTNNNDPFYKLLPLYTTASFEPDNTPREVVNKSYLKQIVGDSFSLSAEEIRDKVCQLLRGLFSTSPDA